MKKTFLFPHWCQIVGLWIMAAMVAFSVIVFVLTLANFDYPDWFEGLLYSAPFFPSAVLFLICLSQEKEEDEYIAHLRARSVFIIVTIAFVISLIDFPVKLIGARLLSPSQLGNYLLIVKLFFGPMSLSLIYLVLFKGSLFVNRLKYSNDDGQ